MIERELGAGGMGVVYAAFDPELERTVALKVIRRGLADDAEQRLLREARAMARLAHPNVVTVYEVGTAEGRDYIAMELIDGGNLVDWLRSAKRPVDEVVQAFVAAGRGLATAHEAGLVHRDFKPHNVLRSKRGRVMVTDFGLARESAEVTPASTPTSNPVSTLSGLTEPGALLGTPAYMPPEQWHGGEVTAATDQFAFCVALWEGLAGERPFAGESVGELRANIEAGPGALDTSKVPRRLRRVLVRGLAVDPAKRWPSMGALLGRLEPRRRSVALGIAGVIVAALVVALVVESRHADANAVCAAPALKPASVWSWPIDVPIRAGAPDAANRLAATFRHWQDVRGQVCSDPSPARAERLTCLDKVLARIDALVRLRTMDPTGPTYGLIAHGYEADVCLRADPPRLPAHYSEAALVGLGLRGGAHLPKAAIERARADLAHDDCARAYFGFLDPATFAEAERASQVCGDDQANATSLMNAVGRDRGMFPDASLASEVAAAERAVAHAAQPFLIRQFDRFHSEIQIAQGDLDGAVASLDRALGGEVLEFDIDVKARAAQLRLQRFAAGDLDAVIATSHPLPQFGVLEQSARWFRGEDTAAALATWNATYLADVPKGPPIRGTVVDGRGVGVAGATVFAGPELKGDATTAVLALWANPGDLPDLYTTTTTDKLGHFMFAHTYPSSRVIAQAGADRSGTATGPEVRLVLHPTIVVHGTLGAPLPAGQLYIEARSGEDPYPIVAPVLANGTFTLGGVSAGELQLRVANLQGTRKNYSAPRTTVAFPALPTRELTVIVRSAMPPIDVAQVSITDAGAGATLHPTTVGELRTYVHDHASASDLARASAQPGELVAHVRGAPAGRVTVCAWGIHVDRDDPAFLDHYNAHEDRQPLACVTIEAAATELAITVPAMIR